MIESKKLIIEPVSINKDFVYGLNAQKESSLNSEDRIISSALKLKEQLGLDWKYLPNTFPKNFSNFLRGWNTTNSDYHNSENDPELLFLNIDLEDNGCTRKCSHCFTMSGMVDIERGRKKNDKIPAKVKKKITKDRLISQIALAKEKLGLKAVRILGRGEPTESPYLLDFLYEMKNLGIITVIFTRGHVIGNDLHSYKVFNKHGIKNGYQLAEKLNELDASVVLGYSALNDTIHDGMTGINNHSKFSREGLKRLVALGFQDSTPTRIAIEAPIAKINMDEMPISYLLFQCLGISPIFNSYMVTGRADQKYFDSNTPKFEERLKLHAQVYYFMKSLGIVGKIGPYLGTKECHDVSNGLYIPSSGEIRPCTGYESKNSIQGDLNEINLDEIWNNSNLKGKQSICPPKINHGFPLNYEELLIACIEKNMIQFKQDYERIIQKLGLT